MRAASVASGVPALAALMLAACSSNTPRSVAPAPVQDTTAVAAVPDAAAEPGHAPRTPGSSYRRVVRDGEEYFCRREGVTGSRLQTNTVCLTAAQIEARSQRSKEFMLNGTGNNPGTPEAASSAPVFPAR